ncbi:SusD/RagB family nutrient-binding outer membrane lipoprotein [Myroides sp. LJL115]
MKKFLYTLGIFSIVSVMISCDKDLEEINQSPNSPSFATTSGLFNQANKSLMDNTRGGFPSGRMTLPIVQMSAQREYNEEDRYVFRVGVNNSLYHNLQLSVRKYKEIILICENPELSDKWAGEYGNIQNQIAAARIMIAYCQLELVGLYGDVSYYSYGSDDPEFQGQSKGEDIAYDTPVFASQEKIYKDLMKELKEASEQIDLSTSKVMDGDFIFKKPEVMKRFANSLRLRVANRVKAVIPEAEAHIKDAIAQGVMQSNEDNVGLTYENNVVMPAPWFSDAMNGRRNDFSPASTFIDLLKGEVGPVKQVDPRLYIFAAPYGTAFFGVAGGNSIEGGAYVSQKSKDSLHLYRGAPYGIGSTLSQTQGSLASQFGSFIYKPNYTQLLMEYSEVAFLLSENSNWDNDWYKKGIKASMEKFGVPEAEITAYIDALPTATAESVITQKYIGLFMQPNEAWAEYRRTGFPNTLIQPGQTGVTIGTDLIKSTTYEFIPGVVIQGIPQRFEYPTDLQSLNKDNLGAAISKLDKGDSMDSKLLFAKK